MFRNDEFGYKMVNERPDNEDERNELELIPHPIVGRVQRREMRETLYIN